MPAPVQHEPHLSFLDGLPLSREAVRFATGRHAGQRRPGDRASFVMHPVEAAALLARSHYPARFGPEVADPSPRSATAR